MAQEIMGAIEGYENEPINIIGHSRGGAAAIRLANELNEVGLDVENVVTLDPVSRKGTRETLDSDSTVWTNVYVPDAARTGGRLQLMHPDTIARIGGQWGYQPTAEVNLPISDWYGRYEGRSGHMAVVGDYSVVERLRRALREIEGR